MIEPAKLIESCRPDEDRADEICHDNCWRDVQQRWRDLATSAAGISPTRIPLEPLPEDIDSIGDDLRLLARRVDAIVDAYGAYMTMHAPGIDRSVFSDVLFGALDGNALYEINCAAERLRDDRLEQSRYCRYNRSYPD